MTPSRVSAWVTGSAPPPPPATSTAPPIRPARRSGGVSGLFRRVQRGRFLGGSGEPLEPARGVVELVAIDVRVASHGREVGKAEVLGDEAGIAALLPKPGRGSVAQRVGGDVLLDPGARSGASDDVGSA